jgi:hypothetical protein
LRIGGEIVAARRGVSDGVRGAVRAADGDGMVSVGFFSWRLRRVRSDKPRTTGPTVGVKMGSGKIDGPPAVPRERRKDVPSFFATSFFFRVEIMHN